MMSDFPKAFIDQTGRSITLEKPPRRIISLVPSQSELLFDLGLKDKIVGITRYCLFPPEAKSEKAIVGGTKRFYFDKIESLQPDLIIGNMEENYLEGIEKLSARFPVWMSDIASLSEALEMIRQIGMMTASDAAARGIVSRIETNFSTLPSFSVARAAYLIWKDPWMVAGGDTFIDAMLTLAGFENVFRETPRYPQTTLKDLIILEPDLLLLSSEPYQFKQDHIEELKGLFPATKILRVDGMPFSWYGSRLEKAPAYFINLRRGME